MSSLRVALIVVAAVCLPTSLGVRAATVSATRPPDQRPKRRSRP